MLVEEELFCVLLRLLNLLSENEIVLVRTDSFPEGIVLIDVLIGGQPVVLMQRKDSDNRHGEEVYDQNRGILAPACNHVSLWRELYDLDVGNGRLVHVLE